MITRYMFLIIKIIKIIIRVFLKRFTIDVVYKKLNGEEISEEKNPLFLQSASYSDTVYRNMIIKLNKEIRFHNTQNHNQ